MKFLYKGIDFLGKISYTKKPLPHLQSYIGTATALASLFLLLRVMAILIHNDAFPYKIFFTKGINVLHFFSDLIINFSIDIVFFLFWNGLYFICDVVLDYFCLDPLYKKRRLFFWFLNLPLFILFFVDMQTIAVQGQLMSMETLSAFKIDIIINIWILIRDYWYLVLCILFTIFLFLKFTFVKKVPVSKKQTDNQIKNMKYVIYPVLHILCVVCFSSVYLYRVDSGFFSVIPYNNIMNGMYVRLFVQNRTQFGRNSNTLFFDQKTLQSLLPDKEKQMCYKKKNKKNVILFVLESFNKDLLSPKLAPFLHSLSQKGLLFKNHLSSSTSTYNSVLKGILQSTSLHKGHYYHKKVSSKHMLTLKSHGYTNFFFFGDKGHTFKMDKHYATRGFHYYYSADDYIKKNGKKRFVGRWGDIDEDPFLQFSAKHLENVNTPFFAIILTNQVHYPFDCPSDFKVKGFPQKIKTGSYENCVQYLDYSIKNFFEKIKDQPWFQDSLFIITGDHTANLSKDYPFRRYFFTQYNVPLIFYSPSEKLNSNGQEVITHHTDILPSVINYLGLPVKKEKFLTTHFIFCPNSSKTSVWYNVHKNKWFLYQDRYLLEYHLEKDMSFLWEVHNFDEVDKSMVKKYSSKLPLQVPIEFPSDNSALKQKLQKIIKAYIQYYTHGI